MIQRTPTSFPGTTTTVTRFNGRRLVLPEMPKLTSPLRPGLSGMHSMALALVSIYLFIIISRVFDVMLSALRIPMFFFLLALLGGLLTGNIVRSTQHRIPLLMWLMVGWMAVTTLFSSHRGGSIDSFKASVLSCLTAILILCVATTSESMLRVVRVYAFAVFAAAALGFVFGGGGDRFSLYQGTYGDPNQYAMGLLMGLPLILFLSRQTPAVKRVFVYAGAALVFAAFLRAGSRGGAVALMIMLLVWFFQMNAIQKLLLATVGTALILGSLAFLPEYLKVRYTTFFTADQESVARLDENSQMLLSGDVGSTSGRLALLQDSLMMTMRHPLLGVGPDQFPMQRWELKLKETGRNAGYFVTHNSYTQMSSENGLIGLAILVALLYYTFKEISLVLKLRGSPEYRIPQIIFDVGLGLRLTIITMAVCALFLSVAYSQLFYLMGALACAYGAAVRNDLPKWRVAEDVAAQTSVPPSNSKLLPMTGPEPGSPASAFPGSASRPAFTPLRPGFRN